MNLRQKIAKFFYPLIMSMTKKDKEKGIKFENTEKKAPAVSFFDLKAFASNGKEISMNDYRGKKIMLVNVASNCGFTAQYDALEKLYQDKKDKLIILGFPANDFGGQEPGSDKEIEQFCKLNFGVSFPLFKKHSVLNPDQNEIYNWLTHKNLNGWNDQQPTWNFCKYIVDENGKLTYVFGSSVAPDSTEIETAIK